MDGSATATRLDADQEHIVDRQANEYWQEIYLRERFTQMRNGERTSLQRTPQRQQANQKKKGHF